MATIPIKAYLGGWEQGNPITLYPQLLLYDSDSTHWPPYNGTFQKLSEYPEYYDNNVTIFIAPWATDLPSGYTHGIQCVEGNNDFYIAPNSMIRAQFTLNRNICSLSVFYNGISLITRVIQGRLGMTCPSYARNDLYANFGYFVYANYQEYSVRWVEQVTADYVLFWSDAEIKSQDPYAQDPLNPETETGGGEGTFDGTGDDIDIPGLPTLSAVDTGFITLFNPTAGELQNLANYMWSDLFDIDTWKKIFADPMGAILGLSIVPVAVPNGGPSAVTVGNISTGVSMNKANAQYVEVDCGTLNVNEYWGAYLDYDPYTKAEIYLPYIGTHPLAVDDIMGKAVHVVYHVDILSGACCAYVKCGGSVLYSFVGQCSCSIPITGNDWTNVINGALSIAASIGSMVATGGASAPMSITNIASTIVNSMKPNVEKSGSMGGMGGMLGIQTPYIILTRPRQAVPADQNAFMGYPSFITENLGKITGYTEIEHIRLENVSATNAEIDEIEALLKEGVIF